MDIEPLGGMIASRLREELVMLRHAIARFRTRTAAFTYVKHEIWNETGQRPFHR